MPDGLIPSPPLQQGLAQSQPDDPWLARMQRQYAANMQYAKPHPTYTTQLPPQQEADFQQWLKQNKVPYNASDPVQDYDMRGFYAGIQAKDPEALTAIDPNDGKMHFPDKWKTPYHETFSRYSIYAKPDAPYWIDNRYLVTPRGQVLFDDQHQPAHPGEN